MNHPDFMSLGPPRPVRRIAQRGVSLVFALLALGAMMLAAVALVRSVDSGAIVLGNLGFKQEATQAADRAAEVARAWLTTTAVDLTADSTANGYYATSQDSLDPTGHITSANNKLAVVDWDANNCASYPANAIGPCKAAATCSTATNACGTQVAARYLITRLCPLAGAVGAANSCAKSPTSSTSEVAYHGKIEVGNEDPPKPEAATTPYYRIIVRTVGGRGAVSFTETVVH